MNDTETMELCKAVFERLGWDFLEVDPYREWSQEWCEWGNGVKIEPMTHHKKTMFGVNGRFICPAYSLEYVLDKLPYVTLENHGIRNEIKNTTYWKIFTLDVPVVTCEAPTSLQATLKLVLALADAGVLK
jgi:hypothetical protein